MSYILPTPPGPDKLFYDRPPLADTVQFQPINLISIYILRSQWPNKILNQ